MLDLYSSKVLFGDLGWFSGAVVSRVKPDGRDGRPVSCCAAPALQLVCAIGGVKHVPRREQCDVAPGRAILWHHVANRAVLMHELKPLYEVRDPSRCHNEIANGFVRYGGTYLSVLKGASDRRLSLLAPG